MSYEPKPRAPVALVITIIILWVAVVVAKNSTDDWADAQDDRFRGNATSIIGE